MESGKFMSSQSYVPPTKHTWQHETVTEYWTLQYLLSGAGKAGCEVEILWSIKWMYELGRQGYKYLK